MKETVAIIGAGYVGLSTAALLANSGYEVRLLDVDTKKIRVIESGRSFFYEAGIDPLIKKAIQQKTLLPTTDYRTGLKDASVVFSCVGTPDNPDGSSNLSYVFSAAETAAQHLKPGTIYVQKSTVPVGTGQQVQQIFAKAGVPILYVSNPEFLREGTAIMDTLWFDRIVCGSSHKEAIDRIFGLYKTLERKRSTIAKTAGVDTPSHPSQGSYIATSLESAELIKVTANAFLALKISFANSIAKLADHVGADVVEVMDAVGQDKRIGRAFLNAGRGYGGGCFPKDMSGLIDVMNEHGADSQILTAAQDVNASMPGYIVTKLQNNLGGLKNKRVAVLGLAFKAGTSDARRSRAVELANILAKAGAKVTAYDPKANEEASEDLRPSVTITNSLNEAVIDTDACVVATEWPEFININLQSLKRKMRGVILVDAMNCFDAGDVTKAGLQYIGVGRNGY